MNFADVDNLMRRCQRGVGGRHALDDAHAIMAECYGTLGRMRLAIERMRAGHDRYEIVRRMTPRQFEEAHAANLATGKPFDQIVDEAGGAPC